MPSAFLRELEAVAASFEGVVKRPFHLPADLQTAATPLAPQTGTVVLLSGGNLDCARYHLLAAAPWLQLRGRGRAVTAILGKTRFRFEADPFDLIQQVVGCLPHATADPDLPVTGGLFGYLAYDLKDRLEKLPRTTVDPYGLPDFCLYAPTLLLIQPLVDEALAEEARLKAGGHLLTPVYAALAVARPGAAQKHLEQALASPPQRAGAYGTRGAFVSGFSPASYRAAVARIREYIAAGDVYQVNMSQCYEAPFKGDPYALFQDLFTANPAPFFAFVQAGDHQVVSTSPERFLKLSGRAVETRPIKGTRPRSSDPRRDAALKAELAASAKDEAELSMIVDLLRNDIGRVCAGGSVRVSEHKRVEAYANVYHLVSVVTGELEAGKDAIDLLRATFPGGSITGCPKIRAMEIIDELEPTRRHVYTGSLGYIGFDGSMDLSVAIRTATVSDGYIRFSVGGGVVFDSDPRAEYEETLHKGRTLMGALGGAEQAAHFSDRGPKVWLNGLVVPAEEARLPISDLGLQYGFGLFETIRIHRGCAHNLAAHLKRMRTSWRALFSAPFPDLTWEVVVDQLLDANSLGGQEAAVKIMATHGPAHGGLQRPTLMASVRPYRHRLAVIGGPGLSLGTYPEAMASPLSTHKSLNYLFFHLAGQWAGRAGFDEALILDSDGHVSETNTANLLVVSGKKVIQPQSRGCLPGTMAAAVLTQLKAWGYTDESRPLRPADLAAAEAVVATNALMGPVPVMAVDGEAIEPCTQLCTRLQQAVGLDEALVK
jgi:para-aminobenzoate synthetase component 1